MSTLYVQFLDLYHTARASSHDSDRLYEEARRAVRLGAVVFDEVYIPASSYFESPLAKQVLGDHPLLASAGLLRLTAGELSLEEHRISKILQYRPQSSTRLNAAYSRRVAAPLGYVARPISTRRRITAAWMRPLESDRLRDLVDPTGEMRLTISFERSWERIPEELGDQAFVRGHAWELLTKLSPGLPSGIIPFLDQTIERAYMDAYARFLDAGVLKDLVLLASPFPLPPSPKNRSYTDMFRELLMADELGRFDALSESELLTSRNELRSILETPTLTATGLYVLGADAGPTVAIISVLSCEFEAVKALLEDLRTQRIVGDSNLYCLGNVPLMYPETDLGGSSVVLVQAARMGTNAAAIAATRVVDRFPTVRNLIVVGIAGAIPRPDEPDKNVRLGDVVVSARVGVVSVDALTRVAGGTKSRSALPPPAAALVKAADVFTNFGSPDEHVARCVQQVVANDRNFQRPPPRQDVLIAADGHRIRTRRRSPLWFRGPIASGNSLVRDAAYRDLVGRETGAMAFEMEAAGVAEAAWESGTGYLIVRGLVDYCDGRKNDVWHHYSAATAASVAHGILASLGR